MRDALVKGKVENPKVLSLLTLYTLSKELNIPPSEAYQLPATLVKELMMTYEIIEGMKAGELEKVQKDMKGQISKIPNIPR